MARRYQIKIYNTAHTTLIATLSDACVFKGQNTQSLNADDTLVFSVFKDHADAAHVQKYRIARLASTDPVAPWERSYRIIDVIPKRDGDGYELEARCEGLQYDLSFARNPLSGNIAGQTPLTHMTQILSATSWTVGTVTPTAAVNMEYDYHSVMEDLLALRERASEAAGAEYDLEFTATPGGARTVSLKVVGVTSPVASIQYAKNLLNLSYENPIAEYNVVYGRGGEGSKGIPMTIGTATHRITAIAGNTITLDSRKVVSSNGTWNTAYSLEKPDGSLTDITDSIKPASGNDQLTLASAGGLAVDDAVRIVGTTGTDVDIVWDKASVDAGIHRIGHFQDSNASDVFNLLGPARFSTLSGAYAAGKCEGWDLVGSPTLTENTDALYIKNGTKSQKVVVGTFAGVPSFASVATSGDYANLLGTYTYKASYVTDGGEGNLSSASGSVATGEQPILVTFSAVGVPATATHRRLYRIKNGGATYYKIADIPIAQTTFYDTIPDSQLTMTHPGTNTAGGGEGVSRTIDAVVDEQYSAVIYLYVTNGRVRCYLSSGGEIFPKANVPDAERATPNYTIRTFVIVELSGFAAKGATVTLNVVGHDGSDEFYVDSAMLVKSAYVPDSNIFVADNAATELWHKTYDFLQKSKDETAKAKISTSFVDLYEEGIGADKIALGDKVAVADAPLGVSLTGASAPRVVRKSFDIVEPHKGTLEINSSPRRYSDDYVDRIKAEKNSRRSLSRNITRTAGEFRSQQVTSRNPMVVIKEMAD